MGKAKDLLKQLHRQHAEDSGIATIYCARQGREDDFESMEAYSYAEVPLHPWQQVKHQFWVRQDPDMPFTWYSVDLYILELVGHLDELGVRALRWSDYP